MKKILILLAFVLSASLGYSQDLIPENTGYGYEQLTTAQLNALLKKKVGDMYYNKDLGYHVKWNGTIFESLASGISGIDPADQDKINNISITQPVNLDTVESLANSALQSETDPTTTPANLKSKLESLTGANRLDASAIQNLPTTDISGKQDLLVSGTNIKTVNGTSVLGSGNIVISGGSSTYASLTDLPTDDPDLVAEFNKKAGIDQTKSNSVGISILGGSSGTDYILEFDPNATGWGSGGTIDATVIDGSTNAVSGDGVYEAIQAIDLSVASKVKVESGVASYANGIVIPDGVTSIIDEGFKALKVSSLTLPSSLITIGNSTFQTNEIVTLTIPDNTTTIGYNAFYFNKITSLDLGSGVTTIGYNAFASNQLTSITIPNTVTSLGSGVFQQNKLTSFTWNTTLTEIPQSTFYNNQFTSITIPSIVTSIGANAFGNCASLSSVTVHSGVTNIGDIAFFNTAITAVSLPTGITLGTNVFPAGTTITYY